MVPKQAAGLVGLDMMLEVLSIIPGSLSTFRGIVLWPL